MQKKNYGSSNIFTMQENIIFKKKKKKSSQRNPKASRYHNSLTNLKFQQKFQNIIIFQKNLV
jgi:hypothetical protein